MLGESTINVRNRFLRCFSDKVASRFSIWQQQAGILIRNATESRYIVASANYSEVFNRVLPDCHAFVGKAV